MKKKLFPLVVMVMMGFLTVLFTVAFADKLSSNHVSQLLVAQQLYSASASSITYSPDLNIKEYDGVCQAIMDCSLGTYETTTLDCKLQHSERAVVGVYNTVIGATDTALAKATDTQYMIGSKWTQSGIRQLKDVTFWTKQVGTVNVAQNMYVDIYADSSGPTGSVLVSSATVLASSVSKTEYQPVRFTFGSALTLANSTVYWAVLKSNITPSDTNYMVVRTKTLTSGGIDAIYTGSFALAPTLSSNIEIGVLNYADVTGGAFTQVTDVLASGAQVLNLNKDNLGQYIRAKITKGGPYADFYLTVLWNGSYKSGN